jgi:Spy/CpxP family protein refolding chaperone
MTTMARRLAIALVVSVALNLFLGGFILAMRAFRADAGHERGHRHGHFIGPRGLLRDGDPAVERAVRGVMQRRERALRAQGEKLRASRRAASAAFAAEPFDAQALERALAELRAQTMESQRLMHQALVEVAPSLTPEQRERLPKRALSRTPGFGDRPNPRR